MFRSTSSFDRLLERATSNLLLEPDWNAILQICDSIRSGDTNAKYAINAIKKKFYHENPHVVLYGLTVSLFVSLRIFVVYFSRVQNYFIHKWCNLHHHHSYTQVWNLLFALSHYWRMCIVDFRYVIPSVLLN